MIENIEIDGLAAENNEEWWPSLEEYDPGLSVRRQRTYMNMLMREQSMFLLR